MSRMAGFAGFPEDDKPVELPASFFGELLPAIDDLDELKLTLYCLYWRGREERPLFFTISRLGEEPALRRALALPAEAFEEQLRLALERAVARGTFLHMLRAEGDEIEDVYLLNDPAGRRLVQDVEAGRAVAEGAGLSGALRVDRPNIFVLYEQNIGLLQPLIADELREAEKTYPAVWIEDAFRIAAERNVRSWRYVRAILERWAQEGRGDEVDKGRFGADGRRYTEGEFGRYVKR